MSSAATHDTTRFQRSEAPTNAREFELYNLPHGFVENPYPYYHALREFEPVKRNTDGSILLTKYADLQRVYKQATIFSSDKKVEFGGIEIPAGTLITLCIGAANRDPEKFENPDVLDISRKPNQHLAFGSGPHICLGNSLARLEGRIAIARFVERLPNYELAGTPQRSRRVRFRGYTRVDCQGRTSASN